MKDQTYAGACRTVLGDVPEACGRLLLLGEDNPISAAPEHALYCAPEGCSGHRLQDRVLGVLRLHYLATWRTNLCVGGWNTAKARERSRVLISRRSPWTTIIALGRKVADVMVDLTTTGGVNRQFAPFTVRYAVNDGINQDVPKPVMPIIYLPHPSGRNTVWNSPDKVEYARRLLREVCPEYPWAT